MKNLKVCDAISGDSPFTKWRSVVLTIAFAHFMEILDATILTTAIPSISISMHQPVLTVGFTVTCYLLALGVFMPASNWLACRLGHGRAFLISVGLFVLTSAICGLADNICELIIGRILQGASASLMVPVGRAVIATSVPKRHLVSALTLMTIPALFGPISGPIIGGFIVSNLGWRWIFWVNIPFGIITLVFGYRFLPLGRRSSNDRFDYFGFFKISLAMAGFIISLSWPVLGLSRYMALAIFSTACFATVTYYRRSNPSVTPLISPALFSNKDFNIGLLAFFLTRASYGGVPLLLPLYFQVGLGLSPEHASFLLLTDAAGSLCSRLFVKAGLKIFPVRTSLVVFSLLTTLLMLSCAYTLSNKMIIAAVCTIFFTALARSYLFAMSNAAIIALLRDEYLGEGSTVVSMVQQLAMSVGVSSAVLILSVSASVISYVGGVRGGVGHAYDGLAIFSAISIFCWMGLTEEGGKRLELLRVKTRESNQVRKH